MSAGMGFGMGMGMGRGSASQPIGEKPEGVKLDKGVLKRLLSYGTKYWYLLLISFVLIMIVSSLRLVEPMIMKAIIDDYIQAGASGEIPINEAIKGTRYLGILYFLLIASEFALNYGHMYFLNLAGKRIIRELRNMVFAHMQRLPVSFFDRNPVGRLVTRVTNDTDAINQMYTEVAVGFLQNVLVMIGIVIIMFSLDVYLTLISFIVLPIMAVVTVFFRKRAREAFYEIRNKLAAINAYLAEHISAMKIIQAFNMEEKKYNEFEQVNKGYYNAIMKRIRLFALFRPFMDVLKSLALALLLWYGGGRIIQGRLEFGTLYAFISYINMFFQPIAQLTEQYNTFQGAMVASDRIFKLLDVPEEPNPVDCVQVEKIRGEIEFRNVWFAYIGEEWVLKDVSFKISPGESVAFVGATGAGKTSIINLICGFYPIQKGEVLVDGININDIDKKTLRGNIGLVLQDVFLFSGDIMTNIKLFDGNVSEEKAVSAAEHVNAAAFIEKLPERYRNPVNERGTTLSMGQRQLISFARALLRDPAILVLDEATSSIDTETETLIQGALEKIMRGRTTIAIAHRLSTVRNVDRIIVLHKGRIREEGTHQELLEKKGLYYDLYRLQYACDERIAAAR